LEGEDEEFDQTFQKFSDSFDSQNIVQTFSPHNLTKKEKFKSNKTLNAFKSVNKTSEKLFSDLKFDNFDDDDQEVESMTNIGEYFSLEFYPEPYCDIVNQMPKVCLELSLLELWANDGKYDERTDREIASLTKQSILDKINNFNKSGVYLIERNFSSFLGGVKYDSSGRIVEAESTIIRWFVKMNATEALLNPLVERDEAVDIRTLEFEGAMLEIMLNNTDHPPGLQSFPNVQRSFADVATVAVLGDITQLFIGYMIVFVYVMIMLGKFSCVEQRAYLSMASITGIVMGIVVSYGFCSGVGLFYGPMHNVLPFLLLGIGIDDMFVIVQCWDTLTDDQRRESLVKR
jgi:hypothetical protein